MPIVVKERQAKRRASLGENGGATIEYLIFGTGDDGQAEEALANEAPVVWRGRPRQSVDVRQIAIAAFEGTANYSTSATTDESGPAVYQFDTTGGTSKITQSIATVDRYSAGPNPASNYQGAINVTKDAVEGVDIITPTFSFTLVKIWDKETINLDYIAFLYQTTGKVNNAPFYNCAEGECLFAGASGSLRSDLKFEISYKFLGSENKYDFAVGDITVASKKGWEYLWTEYEHSITAGQRRILKPSACHVEQVYEIADFGQLGIGS